MCADLTGRRFVEHSSPRPNDLGWYVTPLQRLRGRSDVALKKHYENIYHLCAAMQALKGR